jgi:peptide/nickel transport system ATP-binding protein
MIFQDPMTALDPCYRIGDQMVEILGQHRRIARRAATERARALLEKVGVPSPEQRLGQYPHQLSGGLRQRVMIAMALSCEPQLVIADEPTTALNVTIQAQILRLLADLQRETGMGLILITHDLGVVSSIADRVAVMYAGQIVETGPAAAIFARPLHPYTEGLLRALPVPGRTRRGEPLGTIPGMVPRQTGELTQCSFVERCPYARERCRQGPIALATARDGLQYRCILPDEGRARDAAAWERLAAAG